MMCSLLSEAAHASILQVRRPVLGDEALGRGPLDKQACRASLPLSPAGVTMLTEAAWNASTRRVSRSPGFLDPAGRIPWIAACRRSEGDARSGAAIAGRGAAGRRGGFFRRDRSHFS